MARSVGDEIPMAIRHLFAGENLEALEGVTFELLTVTADGWPHLAMLSVGELLAVGPRDLRLALWPTSTAAQNLTRTGRATLTLVHGGAGYSLRCVAQRALDIDAALIGHLVSFELHVADALEDVAPYADLTSGIAFRLKEPARVFPRWRAIIEMLRTRDGATALPSDRARNAASPSGDDCPDDVEEMPRASRGAE